MHRRSFMGLMLSIPLAPVAAQLLPPAPLPRPIEYFHHVGRNSTFVAASNPSGHQWLREAFVMQDARNRFESMILDTPRLS